MRTLRARKRLEKDEFTAAALGDVRWLEMSLREMYDKVTYDSNGLAPIHLSALHGRLDCLKLLIEKQKVDVNLASSCGWRPIHLCISNQTGERAVQCLKYLLDKGADPSSLNEDHVTPVHQAASEGHIQCMKVLVEHGAVINCTDKRGHTPIDLAKLWGHRKCARILASEWWHQEKAGIAADMAQLQKHRMEQVIRDLEKEEMDQADSTFYGQIAFSEWLDKHGLPPTARTEPTNVKDRRSASRKSTPNRNGKTASASETNLKSKSLPRLSGPRGADRRSQSADRKRSKPSIIKPEARTVQVRKDDMTIETPHVAEPYVDDEHVDETKPSTGDAKEWKHYENTDRWNQSCHVPNTFNDYQPMLSDAYPRDIYTMIPTKEATPHYLNVRHPKIYVTDEHDRVKRADQVLNVRERLSQVSIEALPSDVETLRPVLYRCKAVQDLPRRRPVGSPVKTIHEGGMHLTNDVKSPLFRAGLVRPVMTGKTSRSTSINAA